MLGVDDKQANAILSGSGGGSKTKSIIKNARVRFRFRNDAYGSVCDLRAFWVGEKVIRIINSETLRSGINQCFYSLFRSLARL